jgi:pyruvate/2-oxoglutarate dehydrogenase complex dihydrolipoamide dehydrogenase (E3) component
MRNYCNWLTRTAARTPGITIKLNTEAKAANIKAEKPDVVIMAVGAQPLIPDLPGIKGANVVSVRDVVNGKAVVGANVVVAGAGLTGCEAALDLARQGRKVTLVDRLPFMSIASDTAFLNKLALLDLLTQNTVQFKNEVIITGITGRGLQIKDAQNNVSEIPADSIVLSLGVKALPVAEEIEELAPEVFIVGDCACPGNIINAVHAGFNVAVEL